MPCQEKPLLFGSWQSAQISEQRIVTCIGTVTLWEVSGPLLPSCLSTAAVTESRKNQTGFCFPSPTSSSDIQIYSSDIRLAWNCPDAEGNCWGRINCWWVNHGLFTTDWHWSPLLPPFQTFQKVKLWDVISSFPSFCTLACFIVFELKLGALGSDGLLFLDCRHLPHSSVVLVWFCLFFTLTL